MTKLILDLGSCHDGKMSQLQQASKLCYLTGVSQMKLQLFPVSLTGHNTYLDPELFKEYVCWNREHFPSINVFASIWDETGYKTLLDLKIPDIKFAYSQRKHSLILQSLIDFKNVYVSYGVLDKIQEGVIPLYCIPEYPVPYLVDFEGIFIRFEGFSDHTLGIKQTIFAIKSGAKIIEKHVKLSESSCPDSKFAISFGEAESIIKSLS